MPTSHKLQDKPRPVHLHIRTSDIDLLMNALKEIPRQRFIEQFKYRSGTYNGDPGSFVVAKLTEDESLLFALKMDLRITKLPKSTKGRFNQTAKDMYAE